MKFEIWAQLPLDRSVCDCMIEVSFSKFLGEIENLGIASTELQRLRLRDLRS